MARATITNNSSINHNWLSFSLSPMEMSHFDSYDVASSVINNNGEATEFELKIPLTDLGVQKPTNVYVELDFLVNGERKTFKASFDLTW
jgi:hypothetical protein